jgi:hypothetical protein
MTTRAETVFRGVMSPPWSKVVLAVCILELLLTLAYAYLFFTTDPSHGTDAAVFGMRRWLLPIIPACLLLHFFLIGLWVHTLYVDMFNLYGHTGLQPRRAMMWVVIPVVNLYGFGRTLSQVAREGEEGAIRDSHMSIFVNMIKYGLVLYYTAVAAIGATLYYMLTLDFTPERLHDGYFRFFNGLEMVIIGVAVIGAGASIVGSQGVISHKWRTESSRALN